MIKKLAMLSTAVLVGLVISFSTTAPEADAVNWGIAEIRPCGTGCYDVLLENGYLFRIWT